jgi:hypothetical protein
MKNTKKSKKTNKTTRRYKGGIRRNNVSTFITQTAGYNSIFGGTLTGGQVPSASGPGPASAGLNIYNLEPDSLYKSLQSYGEAIQSIVDSAQTGLDIYQLPTGAPTTQSDETPSYNEMLIQYNSAKDLYTAANTFKTTFNDLYSTIYGSSAVFVYVSSLSPSPASAVSTTTPILQPVTGINQLTLQSKLDAFGNALLSLKDMADANNLLFNTSGGPLSDVSPSGTTTYTAYSAFISQQIASLSLKEAIDSTYTSFAGTDDYNASTQTGSRGLYRALLGDSFSFSPSAGRVSQSQSVSRSSSTPLMAPSSSVPAGP